MKVLGNGQEPGNGFKGVRLSGQAMMNIVAASSLMSLVTLILVLYSFYAIPSKIERERQGRTEELQALSELVDSVNDLAEVAIRMTNAGTDIPRDTR